MDRILLTGATGFVGKQILKQLENKGHRVTIVVKPNWENRITINSSTTKIIEVNDMFSKKSSWWGKKLTDITSIIHTAWYAEPGLYLNSEKNNECFIGTIQLAKAARGKNVKRFVGIGSCIEYKISNKHLSLDTPLSPETLYSEAKVNTFNCLTKLFNNTNTSFLWCRLFYLYGEGEDPRRFTAFLHQALRKGEKANLTSGDQIRDFIDVKLAAKMIINGAFSSTDGPANICTGKGKTIRKIAEEIADIYGRRDLLNFGARPDNLVDPKCVIGVPTFKN